MAQKCAICGAEINIFQSSKLADGNYICRKECKKKGFKIFDYTNGTLPQFNAHIKQIENGTKLWEHYFIPRLKTKDKTKKLKRFLVNMYVAEDIGLIALTESTYKFFIFGKSTRACVYRIADLYNYTIENQGLSTGNQQGRLMMLHFSFVNTEGLSDFSIGEVGGTPHKKIVKYFDTLFGIQKTVGNINNTWKNQINAVKDMSAGIKAVMNGENVEEKAEQAASSMDIMLHGDRTEWIAKADAAIKEVLG